MPLILFVLALWIQNPAPVQPRTGIVTGVLRASSGTPLEGVRVALTPADGAVADDLLESIGLTDKDGRYRLDDVSPGRYYIVIGRGSGILYHPGLPERANATVISVTSGTPVAVPDVVFARMRVSGRVIDWATGAGRRIANLRICCEQSLYGTSSSRTYIVDSRSAFSTSVQDDGTFVFEAVPRGKYTIQASDPGTILAIGQPFAVADSDVNGLEVRVSNGVAVQGNIVDRLGVPVPGVMVRLTPRPTNTAFAIAPNAVASAPGLETVFLVTGSNASRITMEELQIVLIRSVKPEFSPVGPNGRFTIDRVLPGFYLIEVNAPGLGLVEREIEVGPLGVAELRVDVPVTRLAGSIVSGGPDPLPKIEGSIRLIPSAPGAQIRYIFPEADGRFYPLLTPGEYRVSTDNLGRRVRSVTEGARDLTMEPLIFDGVRLPEIVVTLDP